MPNFVLFSSVSSTRRKPFSTHSVSLSSTALKFKIFLTVPSTTLVYYCLISPKLLKGLTLTGSCTYCSLEGLSCPTHPGFLKFLVLRFSLRFLQVSVLRTSRSLPFFSIPQFLSLAVSSILFLGFLPFSVYFFLVSSNSLSPVFAWKKTKLLCCCLFFFIALNRASIA